MIPVGAMPVPVATNTASYPSTRINSSSVTLLPTTTLVSNSTPMRRRLSTSCFTIAFGNRRIIDNFTEHGLKLSEIVAVGGIAERSPLTMQLIADTSGLAVHVPTWREIPARGAALFGAVAAGVHDDIGAAIAATRPSQSRTYTPNAEAKAVYDRVYAIYRTLYESLGVSDVSLLHGLKRIRAESGAA